MVALADRGPDELEAADRHDGGGTEDGASTSCWTAVDRFRRPSEDSGRAERRRVAGPAARSSSLALAELRGNVSC